MSTFFYDNQRQLLIYPNLPGFTRHQIAQAIPESREINGQYLAVPRTLRNSQLLRVLGQPVAPVMDSYDWPSAPGIKPYESQKLAANFMVLHPRCFNLSDMGVGKTLTTLWAADWLMRQSPGLKALIVCPLSIMQRVWADALFKNFLGSRTIDILHGSAERRLTLLSESKADFLVVNFDGVGIGAHTRKRFELDGFSKALSERDDIRLTIVDEASAYKDSRTKRHRLARLIIGKRDYLWLLTGTPTPNAPTDAYGLAKLVNNAFGKSFTTFQQESMIKLTQFKWVPKRDGYDQARELLQPSIRIPITVVWDGPPKTFQQRDVPLSLMQKKLMVDLKRDLQLTIKPGVPISAPNEAAARQKFIQISLGGVYDINHKTHLVDATPRFQEAESVVENAGRKIVTFVSLTNALNLLYKHLSKRWRCAILNGEIPPKKRPDIIREFGEDNDLRVVLCDPGATALGINEFVSADTVLWFSTTEKPELYEQGNARVHRPGQKYPVSIIQLVSNPLEREIFNRLDNKIALQGALLESIERGEWAS